jgi:hypothetical protein
VLIQDDFVMGLKEGMLLCFRSGMVDVADVELGFSSGRFVDDSHVANICMVGYLKTSAGDTEMLK